MKQKKYETKNTLIIVTIIIFFIELTFFINLFFYKLPTYKKLTSVVMKKNLLSVIASEEERKLLYKNKKVYLNNRNLKYEIEKDNGIIMKKDNKYYQIILNLKIDKKIKTGDVLDLTIVDKREETFKILKKIWKGDE